MTDSDLRNISTVHLISGKLTCPEKTLGLKYLKSNVCIQRILWVSSKFEVGVQSSG